jgi:hypothetical protein
MYYPYLHISLIALATAASTNALFLYGNPSFSTRIYHDRIEYMIVPWRLMQQESKHSIIDVQLSLYAIITLLLYMETKSIKNQMNYTLRELKHDTMIHHFLYQYCLKQIQ